MPQKRKKSVKRRSNTTTLKPGKKLEATTTLTTIRNRTTAIGFNRYQN